MNDHWYKKKRLQHEPLVYKKSFESVQYPRKIKILYNCNIIIIISTLNEMKWTEILLRHGVLIFAKIKIFRPIDEKRFHKCFHVRVNVDLVRVSIPYLADDLW